MLPSAPWYIDALIAAFAIVFTFLAARTVWKSTSSKTARTIGAIVWFTLVIIGLNATWNFTSDKDVSNWPWAWVSAGYALALVLFPFMYASAKEPATSTR